MNNAKNLNRRGFFKTGMAVGAAALGSSMLSPLVSAQPAIETTPDLVAVRNGEPDKMFDEAIAAVGGITAFVKPGQTVVVKPNIGWDGDPESGANTNPLLVKRIIEHCTNAGAKKVYVFDNAVTHNSYKNSGIEAVAKDAGAVVVPGDRERYYVDVRVPGADVLKSAKVHELILESNVFINVPVLKHHGSSRLTIAMKNLMGIVWDRGYWHRSGLHECIADFAMFRQPDLNVVDAYRVMMRNGPSRASAADISLKKNLLLSRDIVAADAAAALVFGEEPERVKYIQLAADKNVGNMNLSELNIKKIAL